jgi:hypothetical protein
MVLKTLETMGPMHGYGIARRIEKTSGDALALNSETLYPALLKLEQEGMIRAEWGVSDNNHSPYALAVTDLNHDGRPDNVVGYVEIPGSVYFNTGPHSFPEVRWIAGNGTVYGLEFADFKGDGWPDIVAACSDAPNAIWFSIDPMPGR